MPVNYFSSNEAVDARKQHYLEKAQENFPAMYYKEIRPMRGGIECTDGTSFVLDLGHHYVGKFSFTMDNVDDFISAPVRLIIRFAEDLREVEDDFTDYHGWLAKTWMHEEQVTLDFPQTVHMPRRCSCRYIKITVDCTKRLIKLNNFCFTASSSADYSMLKPVEIKDPELKKLDDISVYTLKECMQTFFEDGPKRDRRLWIGDLRLQALANYHTFDCRELVKRSMYLIAAGDYDNLGFVPSYIYETPYFFTGRDHIADYALLYVVTLCDYYAYTGDLETVLDLMPVCKKQMEAMASVLDDRGIPTLQPGWFTFIDWCKGLKKLTALQGVYLYTLERFIELLQAIGDEEAKAYAQQLAFVRKASKEHLFDKEKGVFVNATDDFDKSVHSQVWMIIGGVVEGEEAKKALFTMLNDPEARKPFTPYMQHYVVEAMLKIGMKEEALAFMKEFWGKMIEDGAETCWEAYVPGDLDFSPYDDRKVNSLCHAWSCTPTYLIRKFFL